MTIIALTCLIVVGAALRLPFWAAMACLRLDRRRSWLRPRSKARLEQGGKGDRLAVARSRRLVRTRAYRCDPREPMRQAFAASPSADIEGLRITDPVAPARPKPKLVSKSPPQKPYALLSDAQIAASRNVSSFRRRRNRIGRR